MRATPGWSGWCVAMPARVIKSIARGQWATTERTHATWYQPLEAPADLDRAVHWAMGIPGVFLPGSPMQDIVTFITEHVPALSTVEGPSGAEAL